MRRHLHSIPLPLLLVLTITSAGTIAGWFGLAYVACLPLLCVPGLPLGVALFGRRHPVGWIVGLLLGYASISLVLWMALASGLHGRGVLPTAWVAAGVATLLVTSRVKGPLVALPAWTGSTSRALCGLLLLVPLLATGPFARLGSTDADGARRYRAYFIADFAWHTALTEELAKQDVPPRNPYLADEPVHYYWAYFVVPASVAATTGLSTEPILKVNALAAGIALLTSMFIATWVALPDWPLTCAVAVGLTTLAASFEGLAAIADVLWRRLPLDELRDLNVDALAAWAFKGLRVDNLPRTIWYTPQHGFACALGLLAVPGLSWNERPRLAGALLTGCALGASVAFSPLIGVACCAVYGAGALLLSGARHGWRAVAIHSAAMLPVGGAAAWCAFVQVGEGAANALHLGFWGLARNATVVTFLLQFGPLLMLAAAAAWLPRGMSRRTLLAAATGTLLGIGVMHLVAVTVDLSWAGFRGGNVVFIFIPALVAAGLIAIRHRWSSRHAAVAALAVLALGLPTTAIDLFNAQDVANTRLSRQAERDRGRTVEFDPAQEFHWTLVVPPDSLDALAWIRAHTPPDAVVQAEPIVRGRESWSLVPSLAARRSATGIPVPLLNRAIYEERNAQVHELFSTDDAARAWTIARALKIDYLYADAVERSAYPEGIAKFAADREHFDVVFSNHDAAVYAVRQ